MWCVYTHSEPQATDSAPLEAGIRASDRGRVQELRLIYVTCVRGYGTCVHWTIWSTLLYWPKAWQAHPGSGPPLCPKGSLPTFPWPRHHPGLCWDLRSVLQRPCWGTGSPPLGSAPLWAPFSRSNTFFAPFTCPGSRPLGMPDSPVSHLS